MAGFRVTGIHCDNAFRSVMEEIENNFEGSHVNFANAQEHVPEAERNICTIKERIRAANHRMPFDRLPSSMVFVQALNEPDPSNTNAPRTLDCIYLRYTPDNDQGGHELLHLATNRIITRRQVTPIPLTPAAIQAVHTLAEISYHLYASRVFLLDTQRSR
ncbi:hypothetical protein IV203_012162 [Nitzschia inconspicua]|uniref:Uncharacterized protein n=1 Tax=Nitzschia inconspicua TaxID=303405 RepID=A0A9K3KTE6_9STRA|nr:hypothetical protein IV203_012162 [Nitzschia inconspicua]